MSAQPEDTESAYVPIIMIVRVDRQLIAYPDASSRPQCVAERAPGLRCETSVPDAYCGHVNIQVLGTDAEVCAQECPLPADCLLRQRCPTHVRASGADVAPVDWESFDPKRHSGALIRTSPTWTPEGIWAPEKRRPRTSIQATHSLVCPFGDHLPWAPTQAEGLDELGWGPEEPGYLAHCERERARWVERIGDDLPDLAAKLMPPRVTPPGASVAVPNQRAQPDRPEWLASTGECAGTVATALYRYYDADDTLLYIGISDRLRSRTGDHIRGSSWMDFAIRSTIERHPSRTDAEFAEENAIRSEHPLFNHQHNDTPEARRRLVEYLLAHNRRDLLVPAVSRG